MRLAHARSPLAVDRGVQHGSSFTGIRSRTPDDTRKQRGTGYGRALFCHEQGRAWTSATRARALRGNMSLSPPGAHESAPPAKTDEPSARRASEDGGEEALHEALARAREDARAAREEARVARRHVEALEHRLTMHAALRTDVSAALASEGALPAILQRCAEAAVRHLGAAFARIWTIDPSAPHRRGTRGMRGAEGAGAASSIATPEVLVLAASAGMYTHLDGAHARVPVGALKIGKIAAERRPHLTNDVPNDERIADHEWARREQMVAFAGYPLIVGDRCVGVMAMFAREALTEDTLNAIAGVADAIAQGTERKRAETLLGERVAELARSNADLEQFAYVASHDLQEPLRLVTSYVQLLERRYKGKLDQDADHFIGFAVDGVARMQALIDDLLQYSRVDARTVAPSKVSAERALATALSNLAVALEESGAEVTHGSLPTVDAEASQLAQVFQNLIANAIKFRGATAPRVHVSAEETNDEWQLAVEDNGMGIESEHFNRIFIVFQRLHGQSEYTGNGMGLAICKKIVQRGGGRIWVQSQPGKGSTFYFTIPKREGSARSVAPPARAQR
jgi:signal transduction histidine kinase